MTIERRTFLRQIASASGGWTLAPLLTGLTACGRIGAESLSLPIPPPTGVRVIEPYGPLGRSADSHALDIPSAFRCVPISSGGVPSRVRPDFLVPNAFDGMAAFPLPNGNVRLIRNHEMVDPPQSAEAFGTPYYDRRASGGTTSLEIRIVGRGKDLEVELVDEFASLTGTVFNCAGGPTPWGSWLSCEETTVGTTRGYDRPHGYIFEVRAAATSPEEAVPLRDMGRFVHEAIAVDPGTGVVYETEDAYYLPTRPDLPGAGLYRFIPNRPGVLADGGRLQILAVTDQPGYVTARDQILGMTVRAHWIDLDRPDPPEAEDDPRALFREGLSKGAAVFARLEGAFPGDGGIYVVSTNGGEAQAGQVFHYRPTSRDAGELTTVFESPSRDVLDGPDNIVVSPRGGLLMCEDARGTEFIRGLDREGSIVDLVRAPHVVGKLEPGEFAGACFSPDGRVLFFNVQGSHLMGAGASSTTYALWGPWEDGPL